MKWVCCESSLYWPTIRLGSRTWSVAMRCRDPAGQSEFSVRVLRPKTFNWMYSSTCHGRSLGWTATCFGRPLLPCTNYFAMLKYLHPTTTCLTRPADSRILDVIPAKAATRHGSFQICGDYYDIFWSKVQHMCVFTCTYYTVNKCCWFFTHFSIVRFISHCIQHCNWPLCFIMLCMCCEIYAVWCVCVWCDILAHKSVPCHEGPPATKGQFSSEPAVAGRGRYYCIAIER